MDMGDMLKRWRETSTAEFTATRTYKAAEEAAKLAVEQQNEAVMSICRALRAKRLAVMTEEEKQAARFVNFFFVYRGQLYFAEQINNDLDAQRPYRVLPEGRPLFDLDHQTDDGEPPCSPEK